MHQTLFHLLRLSSLILLWGWLASPAIVRAQETGASPADWTPIYELQGTGFTSPHQGEWHDTHGVVTGITPTGFYLQDPTGDGNLQTSDGIFVYTRDRPPVVPGQCVWVQRGYVDEFYDKTELSRIRAVRPSTHCQTTTVTPVPLPELLPGMDHPSWLEPYEGMLVAVPGQPGVVHGPTKRFRNGDVEIAWSPAWMVAFGAPRRAFQGEIHPPLLYWSGILGTPLPDAAWGDRIIPAPGQATAMVAAIVDYNFGKYQFLPLPGQSFAVEANPRPPGRATPTTADEISLCTFNLYGFGQGTAQYPDEASYVRQLRRRALAIAEGLQGCTVIGLQELGNPEDGRRLAELLAVAHGLDYQATALPGPDSSDPEFPLTLGFLTRQSRVSVQAARSAQGCSPTDFQVSTVDSPCPAGLYPLFSRPPLVVHLAIHGQWPEPYELYVINNHWKSKAGDETLNAAWRLEQARHVARLVQEITADEPGARVVVLGDLNDYYDSAPVRLVQAESRPSLVHAYDFLPRQDRYTYIYNGASQVLDHILISPSLLEDFAGIQVIHMNADYPTPAQERPDDLRHVSDHDPVLLRLRPGGAANLAGNLIYPDIDITLRNEDGDVLATARTDADGDFRFWNLQPGTYTLAYAPPAGIQVTPPDQPVALTVGFQQAPPAQVRHQAIETAATLLLWSLNARAEIQGISR
ncbi:MAG: hypothetical protein KatS3mg050_0089 [Litorilinea sp.]|nr:MAG: hypothetical protein KatS3mg050_0089 [Litorilinea sp.]